MCPVAAKRPCRAPGCRHLVDAGFCVDHVHLSPKQVIDRQRGTANSRGYNYRWQKARKRFLLLNPLCVACSADGVVKVADVVDHVIPHRGDQAMFWDEDNWQSLCASCHSRKTATEDTNFAGGRG